MHKLVVLYPKPADPDHFRDYYVTNHLPLVTRLPGLLAWRYSFDVAATPLQQVLGAQGDPCLATVRMSGRAVSVGAWRVMVGRVPVFLLDTDLDQNDPADRGLSYRLAPSRNGRRRRRSIHR